jgi:hypothetical protein
MSNGLADLKPFRSGGGILGVAKPTEAQKESGNYKKAHVKIHGLDIAIENPRGSLRSGVDANGKKWSVKMPDHYGYFKKTEGKDGDAVDCYVGPALNSDNAFIIDQKDAKTGAFDEHKVMLGYASKDAAKDAYERAFSDGKGMDRLGAITTVAVDDLRKWLRDGNTKKPARQAFASGGPVMPKLKVETDAEPIHVGPLKSDVAGRTDHLPISVPAGAYVLPADIVSALGEGNTSAGLKIVDQMFPHEEPVREYASGGKVPIMAAGGEVVLSPEQVAAVGGGDLDAGHAALDEWVRMTRANTIETLKRLPGPAKD